MRTLTRLSLAVGLALSATAHAAPVTLTFQQGVNGYTGTQDTIVRSNETASGTGQTGNGDSRGLNFGSLTSLSIDGDDGSPGSKPNQGLIRFDNLFGTGAGQIGAGDTIVSATLTLQVFDVGSGMTVHNLLTNWNASTATWNSLGNGLQVDGVEVGTQVLASFGANNSSANVATGALNIDVTSSLQGVQAGTLPGFGWALLPFAAGTNGIDVHSSEALDLALRPVLTVQVQAVPEAQSLALVLAGLGALGLMSRRRTR
jgi:hypothetical protein